MRALLCLMCILGISCVSLAQDNAASWANLKTLRAGEKIRVRTMNSTKVTGAFLNVSDAVISVQAEAGPQTVKRQDIRTVKRMKTRHRWVNSLILAGAGAGIGYGIGRSQYHPCPTTQTFCFDLGDIPGGIGSLGGFLGGGVVGALIPVHETVYSVNSH